MPDEFEGNFDLAGWEVNLDDEQGLRFAPPPFPAIEGVLSSLNGPGSRLNSEVFDIEVVGGVIYAGGDFGAAGGDPDAEHIAMFRNGAWVSIDGLPGVNAPSPALADVVEEIEIVGGVIYAGGHFNDAGGDPNADAIAMFSGGSWSAVGTPGWGASASVYDLEFVGGAIYAGGDFDDAGGDADADNIAMFSGGTWSSLGGADTGLSNTVFDIEIMGGVIYAGGSFENAGGDPDADRIAKFSNGAWSSLNGPNTGIGFPAVYELEIANNTVYLGGTFDDAGGDPDGDNIAQFGLPVTLTTAAEVEECNERKTGVSGGVFNLKCAWLDIPANAIPAGTDANANACRLTVREAGTAADYGYAISETVWDIRLVCDGQQVTQLAAPITICVKPSDGSNANKALFHRHGDAGAFNALPDALGRAGWVCGSTSQLSLFLAGQFLLPNTGFAPEMATPLDVQPENLSYANTSMTLNIPQLGLSESIVGVPHSPAGWDVTWLGDEAGYLAGTAFPTWAGNTALTGHVWNADGRPGIFHGLDQLQHGDQFTIEAWGQTFVYEVRDTELVSPRNLGVLEHSEYDMVTLITCESFSEFTGDYRHRRVVTAVLVDVR
ncbi:MAG: sortase [Chloroflexi bacterium]|nr:MAG: sortase [Chloroflexota bacterium]MBL1197058.1 sortase [Chloroflexota bacterium]NOH14352.1 sortase [Chloroflexota bacterium]